MLGMRQYMPESIHKDACGEGWIFISEYQYRYVYQLPGMRKDLSGCQSGGYISKFATSKSICMLE